MIGLYYKQILSLGMALVVAGCVRAQYWTNGQAASYVIGQLGFGSNTAALTSTGLSGPIAVTVDPATGKVFVDDYTNSRVLRYPSAAAMTDGSAAEAVLGQTDFTSNVTGTTATTLFYPRALAIDASGNLWVADWDNSRILRYDNAATISSGAAASGVLGQTGFTTKTYSASSTTLHNPNGVFASGTTLWVADAANNRVLRFDNAASKANGGSADAVFGQSDFTGAAAGLSATQFNGPSQLYVDGSDNLWVVDALNDRLLMFPDASTASSGEPATLVLGQPNMTNSGAATSTTTLQTVAGVYGDPIGNIYVGDAGNQRVLVFVHAASLSNGAAASYVLGQSSFTTSTSGDGASQLNEPQMLYVDASLLAVADFHNHRVEIFIPLEPLPLLMTGFDGRLQENGEVLLQWEISDMGGAGAPGAGSIGGSYTQLEYSTTDSAGFTEVLNTQSVDPAVSRYSYAQVAPAAGANYYRLRLVAPDGTATYSPVVTITVGSGATGTGLSIYPNPAVGTVVMTLPQPGTATIEVYNSSGGLMRRLSTTSTVNTLSVGGWAAGLYTMRVTQGGITMTGTFVKI
jgi:hypothetical protein